MKKRKPRCRVVNTNNKIMKKPQVKFNIKEYINNLIEEKRPYFYAIAEEGINQLREDMYKRFRKLKEEKK